MKKSLFFLLVLGFSSFVQANLIIHPIRVHFGQNDRSFDVTLLNDSKTTTTYRLEWQEKQASQGGGYIDLTRDSVKNFPVASSMVRYSPRQVTLKAGERQTVKLSVRRPARLADGEYRSHLLFKALPPPASLRNPDEQVAGITMQLNLVTSFSIPVVVQQGRLSTAVSIDSAQIQYNPKQPSSSSVVVNLSQNSKYSAYGDIEAYWQESNGKEQLIARLNAFSFWPELSKTSANLIWVGTSFAPSNGKLRILYKGTRNFQGQTFVDKSIQLDRSAIKIIN